MKKKLTFICSTIALCFVLNIQVDAQIGSKLLNKAKDATKGKTENKTSTSTSNTTSSSTTTNVNNVVAGEDLSKYCADVNDHLSYLTMNSGLERATAELIGAGTAQDYIEHAKASNFIQAKEKTKLSTDFQCEAIRKFETEYTEFFNDKLKGLLNDLIEYTYKISKTDKTRAEEASIIAQNLSDAAMLIIPSNTDAQDLNKQITEMKTKFAGTATAELSKFPMHQKYVDKIVFSKKPIVYGKENEADFTNKFTGQDKIYGMAYMKKDFKSLNRGETVNYIYQKLYIDGNDVNWQPRKDLTEADQTLKYWTFEIIPDPNEAIGLTCKEFTGAFKDLSPRKHKVHVDMGEWNSGGDFELDWTNGDAAQLEANSTKALEMAQNNIAKKTQLPEEFSIPSKPYKDPELSMANITRLFQAALPAGTKILKIHTDPGTSAEWNIVKNDIDIPVKKGNAESIWVVFKTSDDNQCWFTNKIWIEKTYEGGGKYGPATAICPSFDRAMVKIACENVK
jgi:hypothetical protein